MTEDEMVGWHHQLDEHESEQPPGWWRTGKPGVLQSMGLQRVKLSTWSNQELSPNILSWWRRKRQPTPELLPGKPHGWRSLVGYSPWGR